MFYEVDTDCGGIVIGLHGLATLNVYDMLARPDLEVELRRRVRGNLLTYRNEPVDVWTSVAVEAWRERQRAKGIKRRRAPLSTLCGDCGNGVDLSQVAWGQDCEEFAAEAAACAVLAADRDPSLEDELLPALVCIVQPRDHGVAHAFTRLGKRRRVVDWAVKFGMRKPPPGFYDKAEQAALEVTIPRFAIYMPREVSP